MLDENRPMISEKLLVKPFSDRESLQNEGLAGGAALLVVQPLDIGPASPIQEHVMSLDGVPTPPEAEALKSKYISKEAGTRSGS